MKIFNHNSDKGLFDVGKLNCTNAKLATQPNHGRAISLASIGTGKCQNWSNPTLAFILRAADPAVPENPSLWPDLCQDPKKIQGPGSAGSKIWDPGGSWIQQLRFCRGIQGILDPALQILREILWILDPALQILREILWILDPALQILREILWILDPAF